MAQSSNLTIGVTVDTGNATANIKLLQTQIRELTKEITAASKEALKTGDFTAVRNYGREIDRLRAQERALRAEQQALTAATIQTSAAQTHGSRAVREYSTAFDGMGRNVGVALGGVRAMRFGIVGLAASLGAKVFVDGIARINELANTVKAIGGATDQDPGFLKSLRRSLAQTSQDISIADRAFQTLNKLRDEQSVRDLGRPGGTAGVNVLGASPDKQITTLREFLTLARSGKQAMLDWTEPLKTLEVDKIKDVKDQLKAIADIILRLPSRSLQEEASQHVLGVPFAQIEDTLRRARAGTLPEAKVPSEADKKALADYNAAWEAVRNNVSDMVDEIALKLLPKITEALKDINTELTKMQDNVKINWGTFITGTGEALTKLGEMAREANRLLGIIGFGIKGYEPTPWQQRTEPETAGPPAPSTQPLPRGRGVPAVPVPDAAVEAETAATKTENAWTEAITQIQRDLGALGNVFATLWSGVTSDAQSAADSVAKVADAALAAARDVADLAASSGADVTGGFASGGYVRGPGTGRSDSILARLSNGEFVINAGAVRALGVGFLQGLNNFATGGLVMPPLRFAEGGLVAATASGGRPVHLHLDGQSYALSGSSGVVDALVSHANAQQMRSAGVKPSWFAGRPGGR